MHEDVEIHEGKAAFNSKPKQISGFGPLAMLMQLLGPDIVAGGVGYQIITELVWPITNTNSYMIKLVSAALISFGS